MKNILPILFLLCFLTGCNDQNVTHKETVTRYYNARDAVNFNKLRTLINDSITIVAGDYVMPYDQDGFYEVFRWDSIFSPSYKIIELEERNNQVIVSVMMTSARNEFLKNSPMTCQYKISFKSGKISKIEEKECRDADWGVWKNKVDSLVGWIKKNHPELDGFIYDMTMNGAKNYLKAIELYEIDKNSLP
ncbi:MULTISPECIES: hypothetical protein [Flavobacteriaceae]|uniref:hypothetical protein n=1 Tax=Flavobacteriaceae TaxID=49546 RepID=UPI0005663178|nr:hypothetical protein [Muricauda sp. MAR_2010_75]